MSMKQFEKKVLSRPGAPERVAAIERRLLVAQALGDVRRRRKVSTRAMAERLGVSQPRVVAIEKSEDLTMSTIARYAEALGGHIELTIVAEGERAEVTI
jgi:transcriptional regulator with XRE-family HTH domain